MQSAKQKVAWEGEKEFGRFKVFHFGFSRS